MVDQADIGYNDWNGIIKSGPAFTSLLYNIISAARASNSTAAVATSQEVVKQFIRSMY